MPTAAPETAAPQSGSPAPSEFAGSALAARLDTETQSHEVGGNRITMLFDGVNSFAERNKLIDSARETICLQTFIFNSDGTGRELAGRLAAKAKEGVKVRVIYDASGSSRADPAMFEMMKQAGVELKPYGEKWKVLDANNRWHEKHLIVDGAASIEGGMNIANEYALGGSGKLVYSRGDGKTGTEPWRDTDVKLEGPAVGDAMKAFTHNWEQLGGAKLGPADRAQLFPTLGPVERGSTVRVVQADPRAIPRERLPQGPRSTTPAYKPRADGPAEKLYLDAVRTAKKSITIENAYFLPPEHLRDALIAAAKRGVEVNVLTNGRGSSDMGFVADAARYFYDDLIKAGVKIREKEGGTLHSKTATFDGEFSIVGSANLNGRSANLDTEDAVGLTDQTVAAQLEQRFQTGVAQSRPVTLEDLHQQSAATNLKQWALSRFAWTF
jgi:cardiolipin synthase